jgi:hypothetical protein
VAGDEKQSCVVVERRAGVPTNFGQCLAERGQGFCRHVEAQDVSLQVRVTSIVGPIAGRVSNDKVLDLSQCAPARDLEPFMLRVGNGDARQFSGRRPVDGAVAKRLLELRQILERFGHAESLFRPAWLVAKETLDVFGEAAIAEMKVYAGPKRGEKRLSLLPVEARAALREPRQIFVCALPHETAGRFFACEVVHRFRIAWRFSSLVSVAWLAIAERIELFAISDSKACHGPSCRP